MVVPPVIWMLSKIIFDNKNAQRTKLPKPLDGGGGVYIMETGRETDEPEVSPYDPGHRLNQ